MTVQLKDDVAKALAGEITPKFLGTMDTDGKPNCVPVISITPYTDGTLVFGEFLMQKCRRNLLANGKVGIAVITADFAEWSIRGTFQGFETAGERVDFVNSLPMLRYNAYTGIRAAGTIRIDDVSEKRTLSKPRVLCEYLKASCAARLARSDSGARCMPRQVEEKFARMSAVRALAFQDDEGYPRTFPVMACVSAGANRLAVSGPDFAAYAGGVAKGAEMAASILTMEPIAYQVKGHYAGGGLIDLTECYSASPPLVGERLDQREAASVG